MSTNVDSHFRISPRTAVYVATPSPMGWRTRQCRIDNTASTAGCRPLARYSGAQLRQVPERGAGAGGLRAPPTTPPTRLVRLVLDRWNARHPTTVAHSSRRNEQNPTGEDLQNNNNNKPAGLRSPGRPPSRSSSFRIRSVDVHCSDATYTVSTVGLRPPERQ